MRRPVLFAALGAAGILTVATACTTTHATPDAVGGPESVGASTATPAPSSTPSQASPRTSVGPGGEDAAAQEAAARERAAAAPSGIPVSGRPYDPSEADFQNPVVSRGDLTVYRTTPTGKGLTVPVTIKNTGTGRASYTADVRITGPGGYEAVLHIDTEDTLIYPGTTWPSELTATDPGKPVPDRPVITIENLTRKAMES